MTATESNLGRFKVFSFTFTIVMMLCASLAIFLIAAQLMTGDLLPELEKKSDVLGRVIIDPISRAINLGIPLDQLKGVPEYFQESIQRNKELKYLILTDLPGEILYSSGIQNDQIRKNIAESHRLNKSSMRFGSFQDIRIVINHDGKPISYLHIGVDVDILINSLREISYDAGIVFLVSLLVTFELLLFVITSRISVPMESVNRVLKSVTRGSFDLNYLHSSSDELGEFFSLYRKLLKKINTLYQDVKNKFIIFEIITKDENQISKLKNKLSNIENSYVFARLNNMRLLLESQIIYIRTPLFLFVFAESMSISFLPLQSKFLYRPILGLPIELVIGLPISVFMLAYSFSQPFSGFLTNRFATRKILMTGAAIASVGMVLAGLSGDIVEFIAARAITALGYGAILIACQSYILDNTTAGNRTQGLAIYISGFYSANVCGSSIGAILADGIGRDKTFFVASVLSLVSAIFVFLYIKDNKTKDKAKSSWSWKTFGKMFLNVRFMTLITLISLPSKFLISSVIYYVTPIYLESLSVKQSAIGRVIMIYGLIMLILSPITARFIDKIQRPYLFISAGSIISGLAVLPAYVMGSFWGFVISIIILGLGHAVSLTAMIAVVPSLVPEATKIMGSGMVTSIYRFLEIMGFAIGPAISGTLLVISNKNYQWMLLIVGMFVLITSLIFVMFVKFFKTPTNNNNFAIIS